MAARDIPVILDRRSAEQAGEPATTPLTATHKDVALQQVLTIVWKDVALTYTVTDDVLLVTTPDFESNPVRFISHPSHRPFWVHPAEARAAGFWEEPFGRRSFS